MHLIALALSPALLLIWIIYAHGTRPAERKSLVVVLFVAGGACAGIALILNHMVEKHTSLWPGAPELTHRLLFWIAGIGLNEEFAKLLVLLLLLYPRREFRTSFQGFLGGATVALGFATVENLVYLERYGTMTLLVRSVLTVPAHAGFTIPMGVLLAYAKRAESTGVKYGFMVGGLLVAAGLHGLYDIWLSLGSTWLTYVAYTQVLVMVLCSYWLLRTISRPSPEFVTSSLFSRQLPLGWVAPEVSLSGARGGQIVTDQIDNDPPGNGPTAGRPGRLP